MSSPRPDLGHNEDHDDVSEHHCECGHGHGHKHGRGYGCHGHHHDRGACGSHGRCSCGCHGASGYRTGRGCPCKGGALLALIAIAVVIVGLLAAPRGRCS
jgi:hypothetical protein